MPDAGGHFLLRVLSEHGIMILTCVLAVLVMNAVGDQILHQMPEERGRSL